jgi:hypothetical protein
MASMVEYFCEHFTQSAAPPPHPEEQADVAALRSLSEADAEKLLLEELARTQDVLR